MSFIILAIVLAAFAVVYAHQPGSAYVRPARKPAIVLAAFGTSQAVALDSIFAIRDRVAGAFPGYDVHLAFTSNIIRNIWHDRANDAEFRRENPSIPEEVYSIKNVLSRLAEIQETGARPVLVQSLHVTDGEEYTDLENLISALENYTTVKPALQPFPWIGLGEPALGLHDGEAEHLDKAAAALAPLARNALDNDAALVLMGHGNEHLNQTVFAKLRTIMREKYGPHIYTGTVEAPPCAADIVKEMKSAQNCPNRILLAPLMVVAGDHAKNDMASDDEESWASVFKAAGYEVEPYLVGLGSNPLWADIYIDHLKKLERTVLAKKAADS